ncbi:MAG: CopD family protein [Chloroflexi bacterium]|nr:CopD family protein [Chloroflexota bacterium]
MYQLAVYIHLLAAVVWLGGMLFLAVVLVPVTRSIQHPPGTGARILGAAARRFRIVAWVAILTLGVTGLWLLLQRGVSLSAIFTGAGWFIQVLRLKTGLFLAIVVLSALHDFILGPQLARRLEELGRSASSDPHVLRKRKMVSWLARVNLALTLGAVALAVLLLRRPPLE